MPDRAMHRFGRVPPSERANLLTAAKSPRRTTRITVDHPITHSLQALFASRRLRYYFDVLYVTWCKPFLYEPSALEQHDPAGGLRKPAGHSVDQRRDGRVPTE